MSICFVAIGAYTDFSNQVKLYRESNIDKAKAIAYSLDATIKTRNDLTVNKLLPLIQKYIWLYSDIEKIQVSKEENGALTVIASNLQQNVGNTPNATNNKSYSEDITIDEHVVSDASNILRVYSPIHISGKTIGTYEIDLNNDTVNKQINAQLLSTCITYSVFLIIIITIFIFIINFILIQPIHALISGLREIIAGNLDFVVKVSSHDEFEEAASAFNTMVLDIKQSHQELLKRKDDLEKLILERTQELEKAKKDLELKLAEMERMNQLMVGRELRMAELKEKIEKLQQ
jgi:methyl-accepting chemotaxis protein